MNTDLTVEEIRSLKLSDKISLVEAGEYLDVFKDDDFWVVREAVAKQGWFLDELKDDEQWKHWKVRRAVARQGVFLDDLKNDEEWQVRAAVLKKENELKNTRSGSAKTQRNKSHHTEGNPSWT